MGVSGLIFLIVGSIFIIYGMIVYQNSSGTVFYRTWLALGILCFVIVLIQRKNPTLRIPWSAKLFLLICLLFIMSSFVVIEGKMISHFYDKGRPDLDYLIVLGAQIYGEGPSPALRYRLDACHKYMTQHKRTLCIVTGGQGYNEDYTEAHVMKKYLEGKGIHESRILKEDTSVSTVQNIRNSKILYELESKRIGIVTNNFHLYRAVKMAEKEGLQVCGIAAKTTLLYLPNYMLREYLSIIKAMIKRNI